MSKYEIINPKQKSEFEMSNVIKDKHILMDSLQFLPENTSSDDGEPIGKDTTLRCKFG